MLGEQARQMARSHTETISQRNYAGVIKCPLLDQNQRPLYGRPGTFPRRTERCRLRAAAQARPKTGALGGGGAAKESHIARQRRPHRTDGTAIDAGRLDGDKHDAVPDGIATLESLILRRCLEHKIAIAAIASAGEAACGDDVRKRPTSYSVTAEIRSAGSCRMTPANGSNTPIQGLRASTAPVWA